MELREETDFHRREWRFQNAGRVGLIVFSVLALLGVFGGGPLSRARLQTNGGSVEYDRVLRWHTSSELTVAIAAPGRFEVGIEANYADAVQLRVIQPQPTAVIDRDRHRIFQFQGSDGTATVITFEVSPRRPGSVRTRLDAPGLQTELRHLVIF